MADAAILFLRDLAIVLVVAAATTVLFHRLRQPVVLGYILAGVIVGPFTPPFAFVRDVETIRILGEIGVVFLLFALGLEFNLRKIRKVGWTAVVSGALQAALMAWGGYALGRAFGFGQLESLFLGAIVSISSTVIIVKVLEEFRQRDEEWAQIVLGILVVEDILAVVILTLLATSGTAFTVAGLLPVLVKLAVFVTTALVLGLVVVPRLVAWVASLPVAEVLVVTVVGLAFALSLLGALLGFSVALGAFIMGALIAESTAAHVVHEKILPIRDLFTAIFFVAIGMLVDPATLLEHAPLILAVTAAVLVGKVVSASFATFVTGHDFRTSLRVGFGLAQIGEFSFVIAALGLSVGAMAPLHEVAVAVAAITAFTTPALIRAAPRAAAALEARAPRPLVMYGNLYGAWIRRLRGAASRERRSVARAGIRVAVLGVVGAAVLLVGAASVGRVARALEMSVAAEFTLALAWAVVLLAFLPFAILFARSLQGFVRALADTALPESIRASSTGVAVRLVLRRTFFLAGIVLASVLVLLAVAPFTPSLPVVVVVLAVLSASTVLLYGALVRFQERVDAVLSQVVAGDEEEEEEREDLYELIVERYPWDVETREIQVPAGSPAAGRTLRELDLRAETGASVVALDRHGEREVNPDPDTPLLPGDSLVVLGERGQCEAAESVLGRTPSPGFAEVRVAPSSRLVGRSLASARVREESGAMVVGIVRGGRPLPNPGPDTILRARDVLHVAGAREAIDRLRRIAGDEGG